MLHREVAPRIKTHCPEARLIFVLRDPVERLWSHYRFDINVGNLPPTSDFSNLIRDEASEWREVMVELGMYRDQLAHYADHFSREQMKIFLFREFTSDTDAVVRRVFEFVGVNPDADIDTDARHNETSHLTNAGLYQLLYRTWAPVKSAPAFIVERLFGLRSTVRGLFFQSEGKQEAPSMSTADRRYLREVYETPNARLEEWLGRDLTDWTQKVIS